MTLTHTIRLGYFILKNVTFSVYISPSLCYNKINYFNDRHIVMIGFVRWFVLCYNFHALIRKDDDNAIQW